MPKKVKKIKKVKKKPAPIVEPPLDSLSLPQDLPDIAADTIDPKEMKKSLV